MEYIVTIANTKRVGFSGCATCSEAKLPKKQQVQILHAKPQQVWRDMLYTNMLVISHKPNIKKKIIKKKNRTFGQTMKKNNNSDL